MVKKKTLSDLANALGVSKTTVSFVLNGKAKEKSISQSTEERVLQLVKEWGFEPSHAARNLRLGRSYALGLIVPDISNPFFGRIAKSLEELASRDGYHVIIGNTGDDSEKEANLLDSMLRHSVDGILLASANADGKHLARLIEDRFPIVMIGRLGEKGHGKASSVSVENRYGMKEVTSHLIELGCRKIGLMSIDQHLLPIRERIDGFTDALTEKNISIDPSIMVEVDRRNLKDSVVDKMRRLLTASRDVDGMVFVNNMVAAHGIWAVNMYHKDRVNLLRFASFDNLDLFDYCVPPVSSVEMPCEEIVENAFRMIVKRISSPRSAYENLVLGPNLVLR